MWRSARTEASTSTRGALVSDPGGRVGAPDQHVAGLVTTAELHARLTDPALTVVDVRPLHAYNGWRVGSEARGGHIPGAVAFPSAWLSTVDDAEVARLLREKRVVTGQEVVLY